MSKMNAVCQMSEHPFFAQRIDELLVEYAHVTKQEGKKQELPTCTYDAPVFIPEHQWSI